MMLLELLKTGEQNAKTAKELAVLLRVEPRTVSAQIHSLREAGKVILSSHKGYFLPGGREEIAAFVRQMQSRSAQISRATVSAAASLSGEVTQID